MLLQPKYAENIIVATVYKGVFRWYVTNCVWWFLDYRKWYGLFNDSEDGLQEDMEDDYSERFDIDIVDGENVDKFFEEIKDYEVSTQELREALISSSLVQEEDDFGENFWFSLYYDFDQKIFVDCFPEPLPYYKCIPDGWKEEETPREELIKLEYKYWMLGEENIFKRFRSMV